MRDNNIVFDIEVSECVRDIDLCNKREKKLEIIPFGKMLNNYCTDYLVAVIEASDGGRMIRSLVL